MLDQAGQVTFITTMDFKGYYQVLVWGMDQDTTAFISPFGKYRFTRISFGLKVAPTTFQHYIDGIIDRLQEYISAYMEEILIHSQDWQSHQDHMIEVLRCWRMEGMTAKINQQISVGYENLYHFLTML